MSHLRCAHLAIESAKDQRARVIGPVSLVCALPVVLLAALSLLVVELSAGPPTDTNSATPDIQAASVAVFR